MKTIYVTVDNSDDKLSQVEWSDFQTEVSYSIRGRAAMVHGEWFSGPRAQWQNACWCIEIHESEVEALRFSLGLHAERFRQDSIAWAEAAIEMIGPAA